MWCATRNVTCGVPRRQKRSAARGHARATYRLSTYHIQIPLGAPPHISHIAPRPPRPSMGSSAPEPLSACQLADAAGSRAKQQHRRLCTGDMAQRRARRSSNTHRSAAGTGLTVHACDSCLLRAVACDMVLVLVLLQVWLTVLLQLLPMLPLWMWLRNAVALEGARCCYVLLLHTKFHGLSNGR